MLTIGISLLSLFRGVIGISLLALLRGGPAYTGQFMFQRNLHPSLPPALFARLYEVGGLA